jgi:aromatic ring-opening dioxygenase LigB subunit
MALKTPRIEAHILTQKMGGITIMIDISTSIIEDLYPDSLLTQKGALESNEEKEDLKAYRFSLGFAVCKLTNSRIRTSAAGLQNE